MINRQYFIAAEVHKGNGNVIASHRLFRWKSILRQPTKAFKAAERDIAKDNNVDESRVSVTAFNRC